MTWDPGRLPDLSGRVYAVAGATGYFAAEQLASAGAEVVLVSRGLGAYEKAKTATEVFAFELNRRSRAAGLPLASVVTHPGVAVDARTPRRVGIRDESVRHQRNPCTPWAQGKDTAAWPGVRALTDPRAEGGEYFAPAGGARGEPVQITADERTAAPAPETAARVWSRLMELSGTDLP